MEDHFKEANLSAAVFPPNNRGEPRLLRERAYEALKAQIVSGEIPSGSVLSERRIAATLKTSTTPIRAALDRLEFEGLVSTSPRRGAVVLDPSVRDVADHFDVRIALETFIVKSLAGRLAAGQEELLRENLDAHAESVRRMDITESTRRDIDFHLLLCEFTGNRQMMKVMWQTRDKLLLIIQQVHTRQPERIRTLHAEHAVVAEALVAGDERKAVRLMEEHLERGRQGIVGSRVRPGK